VCAVFAIERDGGVVKDVRLAFGGMAAIVKRAAGAEAALLGRPWTEEAMRAAQAGLADDFKPLTDMRASAGYRLRVAQNLLRRYWLETRGEDPLATEMVNVWSSVARVPSGTSNPGLHTGYES
jgi:xanthine dehydrogenase small subunit